jgi:predicted nucleic acid-binding Zn ribbon protein
MPTYVYRRPDGTLFETFQKISDAPLTEDPETGQPVQRVISGGAGLQFKGDGFYLTDYVRKPGGGGSEAKGEGSKETSGDAKASKPKAAKTEAKASASSDD